jgi:hypothetical protein
MSIEAMKQMVEALEEVRGWQWTGPMRVMDEVEDAIAAGRQAIAEAEKKAQEFPKHFDTHQSKQAPMAHQDTQEKCRIETVPAQGGLLPHPPKHEQERFFCERCGKRLSGGIHTCTPPAKTEKQEPVAVIGSGFQLLWCRQDWSKGLKVGDCLYTHPQPKREPLTDEQISELAEQHLNAFAQFIGAGDVWFEGEVEFARAIEATHGIKGEA